MTICTVCRQRLILTKGEIHVSSFGIFVKPYGLVCSTSSGGAGRQCVGLLANFMKQSWVLGAGSGTGDTMVVVVTGDRAAWMVSGADKATLVPRLDCQGTLDREQLNIVGTEGRSILLDEWRLRKQLTSLGVRVVCSLYSWLAAIYVKREQKLECASTQPARQQ